MWKWLEYSLSQRMAVKIAFLCNFIGSIYGFYWYNEQLVATPFYLWPFVPDSPVSSSLFTLVLAAWRPNSFSDIAKQANPAIVKIETKVKSRVNNRGEGGNNLFDDPYFRQFFGDMFGDNGQQQQVQEKGDNLVPNGIGSGFIFEKSGYILTNEHVVDCADEIDVTLQGYNQPFKAKLYMGWHPLDGCPPG